MKAIANISVSISNQYNAISQYVAGGVAANENSKNGNINAMAA
jgi:hypothetical protein